MSGRQVAVLFCSAINTEQCQVFSLLTIDNILHTQKQKETCHKLLHKPNFKLYFDRVASNKW